MKLPEGNNINYKGESINFYIGDFMLPDESAAKYCNGNTKGWFHAWGIPDPDWNTRKAKYWGVFHSPSRELNIITNLETKSFV